MNSTSNRIKRLHKQRKKYILQALKLPFILLLFIFSFLGVKKYSHIFGSFSQVILPEKKRRRIPSSTVQSMTLQVVPVTFKLVMYNSNLISSSTMFDKQLAKVSLCTRLAATCLFLPPSLQTRYQST